LPLPGRPASSSVSFGGERDRGRLPVPNASPQIRRRHLARGYHPEGERRPVRLQSPVGGMDPSPRYGGSSTTSSPRHSSTCPLAHEGPRVVPLQISTWGMYPDGQRGLAMPGDSDSPFNIALCFWGLMLAS
jgi:hypothetical protein